MARMSGLRYPRPWLLLAASVAVTALAVPSASLAAAHPAAARPGTSAAHTAPGTSYHGSAVGNLDCNGHSPIQHPIKIGGYIGLITALVAWYASAAGVSNGLAGKLRFPVGRPLIS